MACNGLPVVLCPVSDMFQGMILHSVEGENCLQKNVMLHWAYKQETGFMSHWVPLKGPLPFFKYFQEESVIFSWSLMLHGGIMELLPPLIKTGTWNLKAPLL